MAAMDSTAEKDDMIDFRKLEAEVATAIAKDEKYYRENDAKFRAIHQKVATYDEFRDIVLASHLKPLDKKDISGGMSYQAWNKLASTTNTRAAVGNDGKETAGKGGVWRIPKTSAEFDRVWKRSCKTQREKFEFLCQIDVDSLRNIFITDAPLGEIVQCLKNEASYPKDTDLVVQVLEVISNAKRFSLILDFLDSQEKKDLTDVFSSFEQVICNTAENTVELAQSLEDLRRKYKFC